MPLRPIVCAVLVVFAAFVAAPTPAGAKDTWIEIQSPNFTVISNSGDKEARKIADQFERFREVFRDTFPKLRVDLGRPLIILAVRNEDSLKVLLPGYWEAKGHAHPAGLYAPGEERHFVALRTNVESDNPYQIVYHEYTHAIMNLNFRDLPIWLGECGQHGERRFRAGSSLLGMERPARPPVLLPNERQALRRRAEYDSIFLIDSTAADHGLQNVRSQKVLWRCFCEVARKDDEVGEFSDL